MPVDVSRHPCRVAVGWAGWIERSGHRRYLNDARPGDIPPEAFPGRWSAIRSLPEEQDPLPLAAGLALSRAGWWRRDSGIPCGGGVVVGADGGFLASSERFARDICARDARVSPSDFIHSFPSTATSLLTQLYGLTEYQATLVEGRFSGVRALGHALDLIGTGRLTRALVASLSVSAASTPRARESMVVRLAVGLCVESLMREGIGREVELEVGRRRAEDLDGKPSPEGAFSDRLSRVLRLFGELGGLPLARVATALLAGRASFEIETSADEPGLRLYVSFRDCDSQKG